MTTPAGRDSQPDMRLVELECRAAGAPESVVPILQRTPLGQLGAYCPLCSSWIKWVPQTERWLALEKYQNTHREIDPNSRYRRVSADIGPLEPLPDVTSLPNFDDTTQVYFYQAIAAIAEFCNAQAAAMGFLDRERTLGDLLTLINTEMSELFEAFRKGTSDDPSEHIPDFTQKQEEWADIGVRWFCHAVEDGVDPVSLAKAFVAKLQFNRSRGYRHGGKRV